MKGEVLPPVFGKAEAAFSMASGRTTKRESRIENMVTKKAERLQPMTPYALMMDLARQMPFVALLGYFLFQVDARNEKNSAARMEEMKDNNRTLVAVVQANTVVMQRVAEKLPEIERVLTVKP